MSIGGGGYKRNNNKCSHVPNLFSVEDTCKYLPRYSLYSFFQERSPAGHGGVAGVLTIVLFFPFTCICTAVLATY